MRLFEGPTNETDEREKVRAVMQMVIREKRKRAKFLRTLARESPHPEQRQRARQKARQEEREIERILEMDDLHDGLGL